MSTRKSSTACSRLGTPAALLAVTLLIAGPLATSVFSKTWPGGGSPSTRVGNSAETEMLELMNRDRVATENLEETRGRANPLRWDDRLAAVAKAHSEEMARSGSLSHVGADGSAPWQRVSYTGIQWLSTGENVARVRDAAEAEELFMDEPKFQQNHRANILNPNYTHVGVGIARDSEGTLYITADFAQLR
jgi:uncharacterized protein YkwD